MILFIKSQDIAQVEYAIIKEGEMIEKIEKAVSPEKQLFELDAFLESVKIDIKDIEKVFVVSGPGSFTASRVSVTIANSISFTKDIPIVSINNEKNLSLGELVKETNFDEASSNRFAQVIYNKPPRIT